MFRRIWAFAFSLWALFLPFSSAFAQTLGPVSSYNDLKAVMQFAESGDIILLSGHIPADGDPLSPEITLHLRSEDGAVIRGLRLQNASLSFSDITLEDGLSIEGTSHIGLQQGVSVLGTPSGAALSFAGDGTLIVEQGCTISGGAGAPGLSIQHNGGEFYASIEGRISGGNGETGGPGLVISPLREGGAVMITGTITGGHGTGLGGHALNLYDLSGNAYVTVAGSLQGGDGVIGGDAIQLVAVSGSANVGISGDLKGGQGESYGGNALIMMNAEEAASVNLSGHFAGGDATGAGAQPGTSLHLVGESAALRARIDNCILEDGKQLYATPSPAPTPDVTLLPAITDDPVIMLTPIPTPAPTPVPDEQPTAEPTPVPSETPSEVPTESPVPSLPPTAEPSPSPTLEPTAMPLPDATDLPIATDGEADSIPQEDTLS